MAVKAGPLEKLKENGCFRIVVLEKLLKQTLSTKRINNSILDVVKSVCSLEALITKLKLKHFG